MNQSVRKITSGFSTVVKIACGVGLGIAISAGYTDWRHGERIAAYPHARMYATMCYQSLDALGVIDAKNNPPIAYRAIFDPEVRYLPTW